MMSRHRGALWTMTALNVMLLAGCSREPTVHKTIHEAASSGDLADVKRHIKGGGPAKTGGGGHGESTGAANAKDSAGDTPLHLASLAGHLEVVKYLVSQGGSATATDHMGSTPLHKAACGGRVEVAEYLLKKGADIGARDHSKETPLHLAALMGKQDMVKYLVQSGADVTATDNRGYTPADIARVMGKTDVKTFLDQPR